MAYVKPVFAPLPPLADLPVFPEALAASPRGARLLAAVEAVVRHAGISVIRSPGQVHLEDDPTEGTGMVSLLTAEDCDSGPHPRAMVSASFHVADFADGGVMVSVYVFGLGLPGRYQEVYVVGTDREVRTYLPPSRRTASKRAGEVYP